MKLGEHQEAFAEDVSKLFIHAFTLGYSIRIGEAERTVEQQKIYVNTGRSKTMDSDHLKKCAIDLHFFKEGKLYYPKELGDFWQSLNPLNRWGGYFKSIHDGPHFERHVK